VSRDLPTDLAHLDQLAFRRRAHCGPLVEKFHRLEPLISRLPEAGLLWNIYDWLLVPLSLWPIDFEGLAAHLLAAIEHESPIERRREETHLSAPINTRLQPGAAAIQTPPTVSTVSRDSTTGAPPFHNSIIPLLKLIDSPPAVATQSVVAEFERFVESGRYEKMLKQAEKFDEQEKALLQNEQLAAEWAELKRTFNLKDFQNARGVIRRRMSQERNFREESWRFEWPAPLSARGPQNAKCSSLDGQLTGGGLGKSLGQGEVGVSSDSTASPSLNVEPGTLNSQIRRRFHLFFDAFCYRWKLYGMEYDRPLLLKISVNPTPHGTMIVIPGHWSLDPRRDLDWNIINRLHRARGAKKQGPKMSAGRIEKLADAKRVKRLWNSARTKGLKGDALHEYICS
jgi:hypothetical protein